MRQNPQLSRSAVLLIALALTIPAGIGGLGPAEATAQNTTVTLTESSVMTSTSRGNLLLPLESLDGTNLLRVGEDGSLELVSRAGQTVWERNMIGLRADWGLPDRGRGDPVPSGVSNSLLDGRIDAPVVLVDLTRDGTEDIVTSHWCVTSPDPGCVNVLTVIDGASGAVLWHQTFRGGTGGNANGALAAITNMAFVDGTLVVELEEWPNNPDPTRLVAFQFDFEDGVLTGSPIWRVDMNRGTWWYGLIPIGLDAVAAAYWDRDAGEFIVAAFDAGSGTVLWRQTMATQPAFPTEKWLVRYDASRDEVVVLTQGETGLPVGIPNVPFTPKTCYSISALSAEHGTLRGKASCVAANVLPSALEILDVDGDGRNEWVTSDACIVLSTGSDTEACLITTVRVVVTDADSLVTRWYADANDARFFPASGFAADASAVLPWWPMLEYDAPDAALDIVDGKLFVVTHVPVYGVSPPGRSSVRAFNSETGEVLWDSTLRDVAYGNLVPYLTDSETLVYSMSARQTLHAFDPNTGDIVQRTGLKGYVTAAAAIDANGDGRPDPVIGSQSGGVFALDAGEFNNENVGVKWHVTLPYAVHHLLTGDVNGNGADEIVAVTGEICYNSDHPCDPGVETEGAIVVLAANGEILWEIRLSTLVWTATLADVTGDGALDVVVPSRDVTVYRGSDGAKMSSYAPNVGLNEATYFSNAVVTPDGTVTAQYIVKSSDGSTILRAASVGIDSQTGGVKWTMAYPDTSMIKLWRSATNVPFWPGASGNGVALAYTTDVGKAVQIVDAETGNVVADVPVTGVGEYHGIHGGDLGKLWVMMENNLNVITPIATQELPQGFGDPNRISEATLGGIDYVIITGGWSGRTDWYDATTGAFARAYTTPWGPTGATVSGDFTANGSNDLLIVSDNPSLQMAVNSLQGGGSVTNFWSSNYGVGISLIEASSE